MTRRRKMAAIAAGIVGFAVLALPTTAFLSMSMLDTESAEREANIVWAVSLFVYALFGALLGLGIARKSRRLLILSLILLMAIIAFYTFAVVFQGFSND